MNNKSISTSQTSEFDSPVEFMLVGTVGKKRAVMAKSKGAQMDLMAYAQRNKIDDGRIHQSMLFPFPFTLSVELEPLTVDSLPIDFRRNHAVDERASECTLVWRGAGYRSHKGMIKEELDRNIATIVDAWEQEATPQLEWALSAVIDCCHRATIFSKKKRLLSAYAFWFFIVVYVIVIAGYLLYYLVNR